MDLHKQFKEETKQDAYYLDQTIWNDYYIEWLESKIEQLRKHDVISQVGYSQKSNKKTPCCDGYGCCECM
jgi:hypothetical protein